LFHLSVKKKLPKKPVWKRTHRKTLSKAPWYRRWGSLSMLIKRIKREKAFQKGLSEVISKMESRILNKIGYSK